MKKIISLTIFCILLISCTLAGGTINRDEANKYYKLKNYISIEQNGSVIVVDYESSNYNVIDDELNI
jgi:hypothetical protein